MIAEVGDIAKVSGSRIATPLAPPRPGSTPISTPRNDADEHVEDVPGVGEHAEAVDQVEQGFQALLRGRAVRRER